MSISNLTELNDAIDQANIDAPNPTIINFDNGLVINTPGAINTINAPITFNCNNSQIIGDGSNFILFTINNSAYNVFINDLTVDMNGGGKAFFIENSNDVYFNNVSISNCNSDTEGGAIYFNASGILELNNCNLSNNNSQNRGGASFSNFSNLIKLSNCVLSNNTCSAGGGAIFTQVTSATIDNCIIVNNTAALGGGGIQHIGSSSNNTLITNSTINSNNSARFGGGIYIQSIRAIIQNTTVSNNTTNNIGGGIYCVSAYLDIINSTISGNISDSNGSGIYFVGAQYLKQLTNVTVANNTNNNKVNAGVYCDTNQIVVLNNTIVANNNSSSANRDVFGNFTGSKNNLIGTVGSAIGFNPIDGNLIGVNPMLGPLDYNGGPTQTMALLPGSPAIDSGDSSLVPIGTLYDQRGSPFSRFTGTSVDIGAFEFNNMVICVSGDSIVYAKHVITNAIQYVQIKNIKSGDYHVYNMAIRDFLPIKLNIVTGKVDRFILLEKDVLGANEPNQDLYITSGHMLLIDGKEIKARDVKQGKVVKTQPQLVYSICTQTRCPILINGLSVMTWGIDQWLNHARNKGIGWYDNK